MIYKLHKIEGGWSVRHKEQDRDITVFKGKGARKRAQELKNQLEAKAEGVENA